MDSSTVTTTPHLLQAMGFTLQGRMWKDEHGVYFYVDNVPPTLKELKDVISGTAFINGKRVGTKEGQKLAYTLVAAQYQDVLNTLTALGNASPKEKFVRSSRTELSGRPD